MPQPPGWLAFFGVGQAAHIAPVVVADEHDDVVGHAQTLVVVVLYFFVEGPYLGRLGSLLTGGPSDDFALVVDDFLEQGHVGFLAHGFVAVAAHAYCDHVLRVLGALYAFGEESVDGLLVGVVVPLSVFFAVAGPLLVVARHWLVVASAHYHAHLVGRAAVFGVVGIECPSPHGGPQEVAAQAQNKFKHTGVEAMVAVVGAVGVLHPAGQARSLIVEENAAILHGGLAGGVAAVVDGGVDAVARGHVGPVVPGRHTELLGELVDAVDGAAAVAAGHNEGLVDAGHGVGHDGDDIFFVAALELGQVEGLVLQQGLEGGTVVGAGHDDAAALGLGGQLGVLAAHAAEVGGEVGGGDAHGRIFGGVNIDCGGLPCLKQHEAAGSYAVVSHAGMVDGRRPGGRESEHCTCQDVSESVIHDV